MIELGLQRISSLLAQTPLPWRAVHVAGTNGKGSVCAYLSRMLDICNHSEWRKQQSLPMIRHGRFTSPHLIDRWDCISVDQRSVALSLFDQVERKVLARNRQLSIQASEFELLTATAFEIFTQEKVDIAIVEVGMGGRLDSTNILGERTTPVPANVNMDRFRPLPLASVITKIGLDHQAFLGDTLEAIAKEKSGIIKPTVPAFYDESNGKHVTEMIRAIAKENDSHVESSRSIDIQESLKPISKVRTDHDMLSVPTPPHTLINISLALHATLTALTTFYNLPPAYETTTFSSSSSKDNNLSIPPSLIEQMIQSSLTTSFPGRQQSLSILPVTGRKTPILLDGAHNSQSAEVLSQTILQSRTRHNDSNGNKNYKPITFLLAASDSKPAVDIFLPLAFQPGDKIFLVEFGPVDGMPWIRPQTCETLERAVREAITTRAAAKQSSKKTSLSRDRTIVEENNEQGGFKAEVGLEVHSYSNDVRAALQAASDTAAEGPLVVAGSLYLIGDVLRLVRDAGGEWGGFVK